MGAKEKPGTFVPGYANEQLGIIGVDNVGAKHAVISSLLAKLMSFAGQYPDERVEPEERGRDTRQEKLDPVEPRDVRKLVRNDCFGLVCSFDGTAVEKDDGPHQPPADGRGKLVARKKGSSMLEPHAPLRPGKGT